MEEGERKEENRLTLGDFHLTVGGKECESTAVAWKEQENTITNHYLCLAAVSTNDFLINLGNHRNDGIA